MEKRKTLTSPAGIAGWVQVNKPSTKFKPQGEYSVKLMLAPDVAAPLQEAITAAAEAGREAIIKEQKDAKKAAIIAKTYKLHLPWVPETDDEANETGNVVFSFKQTAVITPKDKSKEPFNVKIGLFDAKGKPMPSEVQIGRGSKMKVAYEVIPFKNDATKQIGVTLRLKAVQVLELVKYQSGGDAGSYGFGAEDGYESEESTTPEGFTGSEGGENTTPTDGDF